MAKLISQKNSLKVIYNLLSYFVQSAGAREFTNCISADGVESFNVCTRYDTKLSDGEAREYGTSSLPFLPGRLSPGRVASVRVLSLD